MPSSASLPDDLESPILPGHDQLSAIEQSLLALTTLQQSTISRMRQLHSLLTQTLVPLEIPPTSPPATFGLDLTSSSSPPDPAVHVPTPPLRASTPRSPPSSRLRPRSPVLYAGERSGGRKFFNACRLYIGLCPDDFPTDHLKIGWILTFMQEGRAAEFVDRILSLGPLKDAYVDFAAFEAEFRSEFFPINEASDAALTFESDRYFQGERTIDEYIDDFRVLLRHSGFPDGRHLVFKFRRGLHPDINERLGRITTGRPDDELLEPWIATAREQEFLMRTERQFEAEWDSLRPSSPIPSPSPFASEPPETLPWDSSLTQVPTSEPTVEAFDQCEAPSWYVVPRRSAKQLAARPPRPLPTANRFAGLAVEEPVESPPVSEPSPSVPISIAAAVTVPTVPSSTEDSSPPLPTPEPSPSPPESRKGVPRWERRLPRRLVVAALGSERSLKLKVELDTVNTQETIAVTALVDSGATGCFLDVGFVERHKLTT